MSILNTIVEHKKEELVETKRKVSLSELQAKVAVAVPNKDFVGALSRSGLQVIAEIKPASPSKGILLDPCDPGKIAQIYAENGAAAISVLTEQRYFKGSLNNLITVRQTVALPLLRKDFIFDPYQIYEARAAGADAVLLIASILSKEQLQDLYGFSCELGLAVLPEVHNYKELDKILLTLDPPIIGINNRNLNTMTTDIRTTLSMLADVPVGKIVVSESGIKSGAEAQKLAMAGVAAILVGESLMLAEKIGNKLQELLSSNSIF